MHMTRRDALKLVPASAIAGVVISAAVEGAVVLPPAYPSQDASLAKDIVGASHGNIAKVKELLALHATLANATWDWGFGDWETALGAASHTGQREIASLLIESGARPDIFTFAMLGSVDVVRAYVLAHPGIQRTRGPHGITLMKHAKAGGEAAAKVVEYLTELGDADAGYVNEALSVADADALCGDYLVEGGNDSLVVAQSKSGDLSIKRGANGTPRMLFHQGKHVFHPAGAPKVKVQFDWAENRVSNVAVEDGPLIVRAMRAAK